MDIRIASRRVLTPDGIGPALLTLRPPNIAAVATIDEDDYRERLASERGEVVDYGDKLITPAFVNAHTHLALGFLRGFDLRAATRGNMVEDFFYAVETALSPEDIAAFVRMGAYESLLSGVGLVWDHYYAGEHVAAALAEVGLGAVVAPTLQDVAGPGKDRWEAQLDATLRIDGDEDLKKRGVFAALGPHATDTVSEALWLRALELAEARQLPIHAHLAQSPEEYRRARRRHDQTPVEWLSSLDVLDAAPAAVWAHAIYASRRDLSLLRGGGHRHTLVWCPMSALVFGFPARVGVWEALGLSWAIATDCASNNDTNNVQAELRYAAGQRTMGATWGDGYQALLDSPGAADDAVQAAWAERQRLHAAHDDMTQPGALLSRVWALPGACHPGFHAGVLSAGALANVLVWDLDHPALWPALDPLHALAMSDATRAIHAMFVAGRRIGADGDFHGSLLRSDAYALAKREANDRLASVLEHLADHAG